MSRPASSDSKCRTTRRADGFGPTTTRRTVHSGPLPLRCSELRAQVGILRLDEGHPLLCSEAICWTIAASVAGSSCAAAAALARASASIAFMAERVPSATGFVADFLMR